MIGVAQDEFNPFLRGNLTMTTRTRKAPKRFIKPEGGNLFEIVCGRDTCCYLIDEIECRIGGRAFEVEKLDIQDNAVYHVRVLGNRAECDCKGALRHGHCKHGDAILKLLDLGMIGKPETAKAA